MTPAEKTRLLAERVMGWDRRGGFWFNCAGAVAEDEFDWSPSPTSRTRARCWKRWSARDSNLTRRIAASASSRRGFAATECGYTRLPRCCKQPSATPRCWLMK